jgi:hypothetical protein
MESYPERSRSKSRLRKRELIKRLSLDKLEKNYSKINIVEIVGLDSLNGAEISK